MLQTIHDKVSGWVAKLLLAALALVFVFWGIELRSGGSSSTAAAEVNGDEIGIREAQNAWQQQQIRLQQQFRGAIPDAIKKAQQDLLLTQLIRSQLMIQHAKKLGIRVSDVEIAKTLQGFAWLQTDGKFSMDKYRAALLQRGMSEAQFESQLRADLGTDRLQVRLYGSAFVTPDELSRAQALLGEQREVDYLNLPVSAFASKLQVSDADVQAWYDAHKNDYLTDESVTLQYVELKLADVAATVQADDATLRDHYEQIKDRYITPERRKGSHILITTGKDMDDAAAKKQAEDILTKIKSGADFAQLAKQYSKDPGSAAKGGDLGWAGRGMFVGPFEDALFSMKPGEIRGPIKTEFGYHIIRLDESEGGAGKSFEQVKNEVAEDYKSERARSLFYDQTQKLADEALTSQNQLDGVAKSFNVQVQTLKDFTRKGTGEFVGNSSVIDAAFSDAVLQKGENSALITLGEDRALVLRVAEHQVPQQKPLDQVKAEVVAKLTNQKASDEVSKQSAEVMQQLQAGALPWTDINKRWSLPAPADKKLLTRSAADVDASVIQTAFDIPKGKVTDTTPAYALARMANGDVALVRVTRVQAGTDGDAQAMQSLRQRRVSQLGANELMMYVRDLERNAKIVRNPKVFE